MKKCIGVFLREESGATVIEYAILASLIAAVVVLVVTAIGNNVNSKFESVNSSWT